MDELGLVPLQVDTWGPFVFVNARHGRAAASRLALGDLPEVVAENGLDVDALRFHHRVRYEIQANWKIAIENYLECYHCQLNHPDFVKVIDEAAQRMEVTGLRLSQFPPVHPRRVHGRRALRRERQRAHGAVPHPLPGDEVQREPGPAEPVDRPDVAARHRPHGGLVRLLLRGGHRRGLDRGDARLRQPGRVRGHRARGGRAARRRERRARARPAAHAHGGADRGLPGHGARAVGPGLG